MKKMQGKSICMALVLTVLLCGCAGSPTSSSSGTDNSPPQTEEQETKETKKEEIEEKSEQKAENSSEEKEETETAPDTEELDSELYNLYIDINNEIVDRFDDVISSYFEAVVFQEEFALYEEDYDYYWCLSNVSSFYNNMDAVNELLTQKPEKNSLDQAYTELYPVMKELAETLDMVAEYTDLKSYIDDDFAKAKEYHAIIWEDYNLYEVLANTFIEELTIIADAQNLADLERLKAEGYEATYALVKVISTAQEIQTAIYEQGIDDYDLLNLDIDALKPLYDQYVEEVQTILDFMKDENAMYEEGFPIKSASYNMLEAAIKESKITLTELFERVRNQDALDEFELNMGIPADGSIAAFEEALSDIIDNYNNMLSY